MTIATLTKTATGRPMRVVALALAGVATVGVLAGCGGGSSSATASTQASTKVTPGDSSDPQLNTAPAARSGGAPTPTGEQRKELLYILKAIDPGMSTNDDFLVSRSMELCGHMLKGESTAKLNADTAKEFRNGSYVPQGEQLTAIQLLLTTEFCR